jgi:hypothetical protein
MPALVRPVVLGHGMSSSGYPRDLDAIHLCLGGVTLDLPARLSRFRGRVCEETGGHGWSGATTPHSNPVTTSELCWAGS